MLFGYAIKSTENNWLHEALVEMIHDSLKAINSGQAPSPWPTCIPATHRAELKGRTGLRNRLREFRLAAQEASEAERSILLNGLATQNRFPEVFDGETECISCEQLSGRVKTATRELVEFAFNLLTELGVRDEHYRAIYDRVPSTHYR
jgi:hypothetical protein